MPLGAYVHLPFCRVHCTYCPFAISTDLGLQDRYIDALLTEIAAAGSEWRVAGRPDRPEILPATRYPLPATSYDTLYFGGGTPSRTSLANLQRLAEAFSVDGEFSMEANPEDIDEASLAAWKDLGVNRLSIGVQSFHDRELLPLGRVHGAAVAREAVARAVRSGFRTNLDLILGLPNQDADSFRETLDIAIALGVGHISLYMLDLEEGTPLHAQVARGRTIVPEDELVATLYLEAVRRLGEAGLAQYEISNFARDGEECRHNLRYWEREEYHGFGLGAHSFLGGRRFANTRNMHRYLEAPGVADFQEELGEDEARRETLFLRLRQVSGIDFRDLTRLCGQEGIEWTERGLRDGWLKRDGERVAFTPDGFLLSNDLISQLF